ncbi:CAP domain-containing protein [Aquibacillus rhizosphaerae]|uniref:CAP domain-containing protein n=1 Tax=Aquibacillus rhizosphaerae TaxID=3051431 RepID=A0ABT7L5Z5_9BACI|nr:CAP domain-containing protein [Aquibacillus sp. LR5S19]MDL4841289.1 CAP domain-containing protein [Aquibacillus sp. LR5S19]
MKGIQGVFVLLLLIAGIFYAVAGETGSEQAISNIEKLLKTKEVSIETKISPKQFDSIIEGEIYNWIGKNSNKLIEILGEPVRKDMSSYGYTWWVYTNMEDEYIQFGISNDNLISTVFATGNNLSTEPVLIGQTYEEVDRHFKFNNEISFSTYRFELTEDDVKLRPLSQIDDNTFIQFYFDSFTDKLSSIRVLSGDVLLAQKPYEIFYRGKLPETPILSEDDWKEIEKGMEQQIFDITNVIRSRFEKDSLAWDDPVSQVAFGHSKDMAINNYFSHYSLDGKGLKERLNDSEIFYHSAGENIAAQYTDGPAAVEGWLNSEEHRDAMLKDEYTHLGVGVYQYYYTQNFLRILSEQ